MYFNIMPKIYYDSVGTGKPKIVTNLLRRVGIRNKVKTNTMLFDTYSVREGETPEIIAHKMYGDPELHWIVMLVNDIVDRYHDWPMGTSQFNSYLNKLRISVCFVPSVPTSNLRNATVGFLRKYFV